MATKKRKAKAVKKARRKVKPHSAGRASHFALRATRDKSRGRKIKKVKKASHSARSASRGKKSATKKPMVFGKVEHYYDHIGVAAFKLKNPLKVGDMITVKRGEHEFTQMVDSMQIEHESVTKAKKGESIGLKLVEKAKEGALVLKA